MIIRLGFLFAIIFCIGFFLLFIHTVSLYSPSAAYLGLIHVQGNHLVDKDGKRLILRGASRWSLEFSCGDGHFRKSDFASMKSWGMNTVRIPFNENYFLHPSLCTTNYQTTLANAITNAKANRLYVLLDLHWIHPQEVTNIDERGGQFPMPDTQALRVWQQLIQEYKNDPSVFFEFMNEPHDISCSVWKNGGIVISKGNTGWIQQVTGTYSTPGLQKFIDVARSMGAENLIIQGVSGEADLTCVQKFPLSDPGHNIAYQAHFYGTNPQESWAKEYKNLTDTYPIIAGEFDDTQAKNVLPFFENHLQTGYLFWAWNNSTVADDNRSPQDATWQYVHNFMKNASGK